MDERAGTERIVTDLTPEEADALAEDLYAVRKYADRDVLPALWDAQRQIALGLVSTWPGRWPRLEADLNREFTSYAQEADRA